MKQVLLVAAIYSLVLYQTQKKAKEKISPVAKEYFRTAQRPVAKAVSLPLKVYQQYLRLRNDNYGRSGTSKDLVFARWD